MQSRNGSAMRASRTASASFGGSAAKPGASNSISHGMMNSPSNVNTTRIRMSPARACSANARAAASPPSP